MSTPEELNILVVNYRLKERHLDIISAAGGTHVRMCEFQDIAKHIHDCDILVYWSMDPLEDHIIDNAPRLKWIHLFSAGVESINFKKLENTNIIVTNSKGIGGIPLAEHVLAMMLAFTRGVNIYVRQQQQHIWQFSPVDEIYEKTLGIIGLGAIGRTIAKKAKALGMRVLAVNRHQATELFVDRMYPSDPDNISKVFAESDFVVVCLPLTEETKGMVNLSHFSAMKPSAYFFNISRGAIVNEKHLTEALQTGLIKGAGLDVFETEPLPAESPLWDMPNVIITPHMGAASPLYTDRAVKLFADNLTRYLSGTQLLNVIDKSMGY